MQKHSLKKSLFPLFISAIPVFVHAQPQTPVFKQFKPVSTQYSSPQQNIVPFQTNSILPNNPQLDAQNLKMLQQGGMTMPGQPRTSQQQQLADVEKEEKQDERVANINRFQRYIGQFLQMDPDNFSLTKAVYLSEAAYYNTPPSYAQFVDSIKYIAAVVQQILKHEGLGGNNNAAINYAIQKLYSGDNFVYESKTGKTNNIRFRYDFDDFDGANDWTKMFVTKLLQTHSGQCHSLPLLYLCIAEQLHAKAYLALAPNHSFIQFFDSRGKLHNFETTNGHWVSTDWLIQSDAITATAYKNQTYLDTLSSRRLFAQCLSDLQMAYLVKNGYDYFSGQLPQKILSIDSANLNALTEAANHAFYIFKDVQKAAGYPPKEHWSRYPQLHAAYTTMINAHDKVVRTGLQDMPKEQYKQWLQSFEQEKQKERYRQEQVKMKQQIDALKK